MAHVVFLSTGRHCSRGANRTLGSLEKGAQYIRVVLERLHEAGAVCQGVGGFSAHNSVS